MSSYCSFCLNGDGIYICKCGLYYFCSKDHLDMYNHKCTCIYPCPGCIICYRSVHKEKIK